MLVHRTLWMMLSAGSLSGCESTYAFDPDPRPMLPNALLLLNAAEVRRRSLKLWSGIPNDVLGRKPDDSAMTCIEMVRHVLEGEYLYLTMIKARRSVPSEVTPFSLRPLVSVADEVAFAQPHRDEFLALIESFAPEQLATIEIDRTSDAGYKRRLGDFILRAAYHEAVHCGQLLANLRAMGVDRPNVWD
jgi:uncharacterized damage-inducible protein DinB